MLRGQMIDVEIDIAHGLHAFSIVGLPDKAMEEAKDRISAAIKNSGFTSPKQKNQKLTISLAPADIRKEGSSLDLAMAIGYLLAAGEIGFDPKEKLFIGELSLDGQTRSIPGVLPMVLEAKRSNFKEIYLPFDNANEGALVENISIIPVKSLQQLIEHFADEDQKIEKHVPTNSIDEKKEEQEMFEEIHGQGFAKRALQIAAAGRHNIILSGPPGTGKTLLARAMCSILPELSSDEALEVTAIHSVTNNGSMLVKTPPFRSPHHTSSYVSLVGGGSHVRPGEITMAHHGVLFLDEFPEFDRAVIETLRQPIEEHVVHISRARGRAIFPAHFILVAAMNPCPCGYRTSKKRKCVCNENDISRYQKKISGPILDRIDLNVEVSDIDYKELEIARPKGETQNIKQVVMNARNIQRNRFKNHKRKISTNSEMSPKELLEFSNISQKGKQVLQQASDKLGLSMRAYHRVWRLARTIADLDSKESIEEMHVLEALQYRPRVVM